MRSNSLRFIALLAACGSSIAQPPPVIYGPPLQITNGGTYSGNWESQDPAVPAVLITTTEAVVIQDCTIRSKSDLIRAVVSNAHVTITNCSGYGLDPGIAAKQRGNFFWAYQIGSLSVEHNYIEATNFGVVLYGTDGWFPDGSLSVQYNRARNLDGAPSDGMGGRVLTGAPFDGSDWGNHFVIIANYQNLRAAKISWNEIISEPAVSWMGDVITIFSSSGTSSTPIEIHDNFIHGGYPGVPTATLYYSGGITMDGRPSDTAATATAYVKIHDNQIVAHSNFGIGLATGHDNEAYANRVVSTGQFSDGSWYQGYAGIYVIDCACYNQPHSVYFNNVAYDNVVGFRFEWAYPSSPNVFSPPPVRQDYLLTDCAGGQISPSSKCINNVSLPDPITGATEQGEYTLWQQKLSEKRITIGPAAMTPPATAPDLNQHGITGSWFEATTNGQGVEVEVFANLSAGTGSTFVSWFTYDTVSGGAERQRWYSAQGPVVTGQSSALLTIYQNTGGNFDASPITTGVAVGTATLSFDTCTSGQLPYQFNDGRTGKISLTRLTQNVTCSTTSPYPTNADFALSGNWYDRTTSGQGFTVEVNPINGSVFMPWYTYAPTPANPGPPGQRWYTAQGAFTPGMRSIPVTLYETTGGVFDTATPPGQSTAVVGSGTMAFQSCTAATFGYSFTAGSSSGQSGIINLSRVGPVPPGCTL